MIGMIRSERDHTRELSPAAQEAARLLRAYSSISTSGVQRLVRIVPGLSAAESEILVSDDQVAANLALFRGEHGDLMAIPDWHGWVVVLGLTAFLGAVILSLVYG